MRALAVILLSLLALAASVGAAAQAASSRGKKPLIRFARDAAPGETITFDMISQIVIPADLVTSSYVTPDQASYIVNQKISLPVLEGDLLQWSFFEITKGAAPSEECRKAAAEPDGAQAQIARARQIVTSMKRAGAPGR